MLTRREILIGAVAAGTILRTGLSSSKAAQPGTPVNFDVPAGACDCHTHIHGDPEKFPLFPGRVYTPEMALPEEMSALHKALHIQRVVVVTPSVYGTDNSSTLYGMKARGGMREVSRSLMTKRRRAISMRWEKPVSAASG